ncbi:MAG: (2Fe-2S) ferredoxin domain-containing protein [Nitrospiraceae bacterium]|nr:MAG: (2Fe-2S) ferredoxin domain-containing protein [Nitrospiraceae bacterium]
MAIERESPFACHIFVCTYDRKREKKSCADHDVKTVRDRLKQEIADRGWKKQVRVSQSGCLGPCDLGPNVMVYPQKIWFSGVTPSDIGKIISKVENILKEQ